VNPPLTHRDAVALSPTDIAYAAHRTAQRNARRARRKAAIQERIREAVGPDLAAATDVVLLSDSHAEVRYGSRTLHIEDMVDAPTSWYTRRTLGLRWGRRRPEDALQILFARVDPSLAPATS